MAKANQTQATVSGSVNIGILIERYLAGPDGNKFNSLFEGEIREKLIKPLFEKIESRLRSAPIQVAAIKLDDIIKDAVSKIKIEPATIGELNTAVNNSFKGIAKSLQDSLSGTDIGEKFTKISETIINNIADTISHIKVSDEGILQNSIFNKLVFPEVLQGKEIETKYKELAVNILKYINKVVDKIDIDEKGISQNTLLKTLLNTTPEFGLIARINYEYTINKFLNKLRDHIDNNLNLSTDKSKPLDIGDLFKQLVSSSSADPLATFFGSATQQYKTVVNKLLTEIEKGIDGYTFGVNKEPLNLNGLLEAVLSGSKADGFSFWSVQGVQNRYKYQELVNELLDKLTTGVKNFNFEKNDKPLDLKSLLDHVLSDTDGLGREWFGLKKANNSKYNTLVATLLNTLTTEIGKIKVDEEPLTAEKLIKLLLNDTGSPGSSGMSGVARSLFDKLASLVEGKDKDEKDETVSGVSRVTLTSSTIRSIKKALKFDDIIENLAKDINKSLKFVTKDLLKSAEAEQYKEDLVKAIKNIKTGESSKENSEKGWVSTLIDDVFDAYLIKRFLPFLGNAMSNIAGAVIRALPLAAAAVVVGTPTTGGWEPSFEKDPDEEYLDHIKDRYEQKELSLEEYTNIKKRVEDAIKEKQKNTYTAPDTVTDTATNNNKTTIPSTLKEENKDPPAVIPSATCKEGPKERDTIPEAKEDASASSLSQIIPTNNFAEVITFLSPKFNTLEIFLERISATLNAIYSKDNNQIAPTLALQQADNTPSSNSSQSFQTYNSTDPITAMRQDFSLSTQKRQFA